MSDNENASTAGDREVARDVLAAFIYEQQATWQRGDAPDDAHTELYYVVDRLLDEVPALVSLVLKPAADEPTFVQVLASPCPTCKVEGGQPCGRWHRHGFHPARIASAPAEATK